MEQKTIGKFMTALRKANGMTQKDLAELLNVSDKTISRWERDEGAPDLSAIPVIAEIFGVTCDELLRGERRSPADRADTVLESEPTPRGEKQRKLLLKTTLSQYQSRTYIAMGISVVGMIAALIGNLAFLKAVLGFLIGAIFFAASAVCQAVFINRALFSVEDAGLDPSDLSAFKRRIIALAQRSFGVTVSFVGFTFPLIMMDAYVGLSADNMLIFGLMGAAAFLLIYAVCLHFINASLLKKGIYTLTDKELDIYRRNRSLKRKCFVALAVIIAVTAVGHTFATTIWSPFTIMKGITFNDYESFVTFMEQDIPAEPYGTFGGGTTATEIVPPLHNYESDTTYYDEYGNEISVEEALTRRLTDKNGNVLCEYVERNESVVYTRYSGKDDTLLPITVYTQDALSDARAKASARHVIFALVYCVEVAAVLVVYLKKRAR